MGVRQDARDCYPPPFTTWGVCGNPVVGGERVTHYLQKYGYLDNRDMVQGITEFQTMSGLTVTGDVDEATESQMLLLRCGARDVDEDAADMKDGVLRYRVTKYPQSSLMSEENIDNTILTAANLWKNEAVEIVKSEDDISESDTDITIVFCDFTECLDNYFAEDDGEELARPVRGEDGKTILYLDSTQSWADDSTLSHLSYGGVMHLQVQLLQVMTHQFGHLLGLHHSHRVTSSMAPFYMEWVNGVQPDKEDLLAVSGSHKIRINYFPVFFFTIIIVKYIL